MFVYRCLVAGWFVVDCVWLKFVCMYGDYFGFGYLFEIDGWCFKLVISGVCLFSCVLGLLLWFGDCSGLVNYVLLFVCNLFVYFTVLLCCYCLVIYLVVLFVLVAVFTIGCLCYLCVTLLVALFGFVNCLYACMLVVVTLFVVCYCLFACLAFCFGYVGLCVTGWFYGVVVLWLFGVVWVGLLFVWFYRITVLCYGWLLVLVWILFKLLVYWWGFGCYLWCVYSRLLIVNLVGWVCFRFVTCLCFELSFVWFVGLCTLSDCIIVLGICCCLNFVCWLWICFVCCR